MENQDNSILFVCLIEHLEQERALEILALNLNGTRDENEAQRV